MRGSWTVAMVFFFFLGALGGGREGLFESVVLRIARDVKMERVQVLRAKRTTG